MGSVVGKDNNDQDKETQRNYGKKWLHCSKFASDGSIFMEPTDALSIQKAKPFK